MNVVSVVADVVCDEADSANLLHDSQTESWQRQNHGPNVMSVVADVMQVKMTVRVH